MGEVFFYQSSDLGTMLVYCTFFHTLVLQLILSWHSLITVLVVILSILFILSGVSTFVFRRSANIRVSALRKRSLQLSATSILSKSYWILLVNVFRKPKTSSVESVWTLCSSRYSSSSFLISPKINVLLTLLSASFCVKPKRFLDVSILEYIEDIYQYILWPKYSVFSSQKYFFGYLFA